MNNNLNDQFLAEKKNQYFLKHIATIFIRLELNFNDHLKNSTQFPLAVDCLTSDAQVILFKVVANTFEYKIVNLLEVQLVHSVSSEEAFTILEDILLTSFHKFISSYFENTDIPLSDFGFGFSLCDLVVWNYILNYFCTGKSQGLQEQQSLNLSEDLLEEHVLAILDHFVIKLSNIIVDTLLNMDDTVLSRSCLHIICHPTYLPQRYLINLKNNLLLFKALDFYVYNPKLMYENKYSLFSLDSGMIFCKTIYSDRQRELSILSRPQLVILLLLEIQDLLLPKLKNFIYLLGKSLIYIFSYILGTAIKIMTSKSY
nr:Ycf55 [Erythrotrichia foliiformis]